MMEPIELSALLGNDPSAISKLKESGEKLGFIFVKLTPSLVSLVEKLLPQIKYFFQEEEKHKEAFAHEDKILGYQRVNHKEGLRFLTDKSLKNCKIPPEMEDINSLINEMDVVMKKICEVISLTMFGSSTERLGEVGDLPLLKRDSPSFGMFDIAHYYNDGIHRPLKETNLNCAAHYDPGLISLNILQTYPGLQLQNPETEEWIDAPFDGSKGTSGDMGVIWFGKAASTLTDNAIKPGIHRVTYPKETGTGRITMWYEVCTSAQVHSYEDLVSTFYTIHVYGA